MPGIVGIISPRPVEECQRLAAAMVRSMMHEPFYTSGTYFAPELGVYVGWTAHENSFAASQVFFNEQRDIALILSGECFADPDTCSNLRHKGHRLETANDWLVHLYEDEGERFFEKLNGLFSGLLIDKRQGKAFLFNDRYGSERIYWHEAKDGSYFASEAKALLRVLPETREFGEQGLAEFLTYGCTLEGRTLFRNIQLLAAASLWVFERGRCQKRKYFSPQIWESQPVISSKAFMAKFEETFRRVLPRYATSQSRIGISLTGGLDTRMIMGCRPDSIRDIVCYTFSGETGETFDDRLAARVAKLCGLEHRLLRIGSDFFSDFASHVDRTVFVTDGCLGVTGAHELYFNKLARQLAPLRLTGNYGSEILRGVSTFKPVRLSAALFDPEFNNALRPGESRRANGSAHPVTFAAFREIPWNLFGGLAASRSQVAFRTPYLDNEMVALAYRAPESLWKSSLPAWQLVKANSTLLSRIPTDRRPSPDTPQPAAALKRFFLEATFKLDYLHNEGWPHWMSPFEAVFARATRGLNIVGLHKYLHYRQWFRGELAEYVKVASSNVRTQQTPFWNRSFLEKMATNHVEGHNNYVFEINAVLTLEAVERLLLRGAGRQESDELKAPVSRPVPVVVKQTYRELA